MSDKGAYNPRIHWFAVVTAVATLGLIGVGGIVTSKGVGMAVPDWPSTYGYNMFFFPVSQWVGGIFWEHSHRLMASGVGLLTVLLSVWTFGWGGRKFLRFFLAPLLGIGSLLCFVVAEPQIQDGTLLGGLAGLALGTSFFWPRCQPSPRLIQRLSVAAVIGVIGQGVLGGLRVQLFLDDIGIVHAAVAQLFLVLLASIALFTSRWGAAALGRGVTTTLRTCALGWGLVCLMVLIFGQLLLGATMRHQHAGLAVPDFPLAYGKIWPATDEASVSAANLDRVDPREFNPITREHILLHMAHRVTALVIFAVALLLVVGATKMLPRGHWFANLLILWFALICVQGLMGAATVWSKKAADIATLHVVFGALTLVLGSLLSTISFCLAQAVPRRVSVSVGSLP
ncbi:MAG: Heme A synthase [Verrucomicrobia subdivision 3 bacterium]|nr:Heme A synthase [Limisphaerales bacterium]MCS1417275.1 Heme A synthase [Limisphaerales bacterium]